MRFLNISPRLLALLGVLIALVVALADLLLGIGFAIVFAVCMALARPRPQRRQGGLMAGQPDRRRDTRRPVHALRQNAEVSHRL